jgi:hypothetical protein
MEVLTHPLVMTHVRACIVSLAAFVLVLRLAIFVRDQIGGALSYAAVLRGGLWPPTPPLCRYAECTADLILPVSWALYGWCRHSLSNLTGLVPLRTHPIRCPCAWFGRRSGIKEESSALGRHGGQPPSRPSQAPGRTYTQYPHSSPKAK